MAWQDALDARWQALAPRERSAVRLAAGVLGAALLWSVALAPALRTLREAPAQQARLGSTAEQMQALQARARKLQAQPLPTPQESLRSLQAATAALGPQAALQVQGGQATVTLRQVSATALAGWLAGESGLALKPAAGRLQRESGAGEALWSGTLVFALPGLAPGTS